MLPRLTPDQSVLALDVGDARIGLARAGALAKIPEPLAALKNDNEFLLRLRQVIESENIGLIVIGLPRNMKGEETAQTQLVRQFAEKLRPIGVEMVFADESLSSKRADQYLAKNKKSKTDQDSLAACFILDEFFNTIRGVS